MKIEYLVLTPSKLRVNIDKREFIMGGEGTLEPKFYADAGSFPDDLSDAQKKEIISFIEKKSSKEKVPVVFE